MWRTARYLTAFLLLTGFINSCSPRYGNILSRGNLNPTEFRDTVATEVRNGLIIIPVTINTRTYRFLFDTGAPLSISKGLQEEYGFKRISKGNIVDSDQNRQKVEYVSLDSIHVGDVRFYQQTAFVADFTANPILRCLELDGILGSNLMRHCNWIIDYQESIVVLASELDNLEYPESVSLPFTPDRQYDMHVELSIGNARISDLEVDYGSTGSLLIPSEVYENLKSEKIIGQSFIKNGEKQSGLIGEAVKISQELTYTDSTIFAGIRLNDVLLRKGHKGLIGQDILSRFVVSIDWDRQVLRLQDKHKTIDTRTYGFGLWPAESQRGLKVQSVLTGSAAERAGLEPGMPVLKINDLDLTIETAFCDYVWLMDSPPDSLSLTHAGKNGLTRTLTIKRESLHHN